jgi:H+-transporting ATPase
MIWLAIFIELGRGILSNRDWEDFAVLLALQLINGGVGWYEERNASSAIAALKAQLAPQCFVKRNGSVQQIPARMLVPGDVISMKLGNIAPADCILLGSGEDSLQVDQSALTGESLPVAKYHNQRVLMGAVVKRGEMEAVVVATGKHTFFGKAAGLVGTVPSQGRFQQVLFRITMGLLALAVGLSVIIFVRLVTLAQGPAIVKDSNKWFDAVSVVVVLLVASIPIAMQVVCTSTMAVGSRRLAQRNVIVARLGAIEELAGMTILCSDKTGTLTRNKLDLYSLIPVGEVQEEDVLLFAALAAKRTGDQDAIDKCISDKLLAMGAAVQRLRQFEELHFLPFNPVDKRTEATLLSPVVHSEEGGAGQHLFQVTKGAPQVVLRMALEDCNTSYTSEQLVELEHRVSADVQEMADKGLRAIAVGIRYVVGKPDVQDLKLNKWGGWEFVGLISLFDPPRDDTARTIELARACGVEVKMITGDQTAIAKEMCRELGMGTNILNTDVLRDAALRVNNSAKLGAVVMDCSGFAEVMPEDKFDIVECIRQQGHVTGMTGDGVNDAPALKRADIGIAVEGASEAAQAAADIVLTQPGLGVIIEAIQRSRKIFQRMRNYCIYRIACTLEVLLFFFLAVTAMPPSSFYEDNVEFALRQPRSIASDQRLDLGDNAHPASFTLPVIALVLITILNDGTIITIAYDKVVPHHAPQQWDLWVVLGRSATLALVVTIGSVLLLLAGMSANASAAETWFGRLVSSHGRNYLTFGEVQAILYLQVSLADFATVFSARTTGFFWERRPGRALLLAAFVACTASTLLAAYWPFSGAGQTSGAIRKVVVQGEQRELWNNDAAFMQPLRQSGGAIGIVWAFVIVFFLIQDTVKVAAGWAAQQVTTVQQQKIAQRVQQQAVTSGMAAYDTAARALERQQQGGTTQHRQVSIVGVAASDGSYATARSALGTGPQLDGGMMQQQREELFELRTQLQSMQEAAERDHTLLQMLFSTLEAKGMLGTVGGASFPGVGS